MDEKHQFKVLRRGSERRAFRLEPVFWGMLQAVAKQRGVKLRDLVFEIADANTDTRNLSSRLRTIAAEALGDRLRRAEELAKNTNSMALFLTCPAPGIILGEGREIISQNNAMIDLVRAPRDAPPRAEGASARFSLDVPIAQIIAILTGGGGNMMECGFRLTVADQVRTGRARVCLFMDGAPGQRQIAAFVAAPPVS